MQKRGNFYSILVWKSPQGNESRKAECKYPNSSSTLCLGIFNFDTMKTPLVCSKVKEQCKFGADVYIDDKAVHVDDILSQL